MAKLTKKEKHAIKDFFTNKKAAVFMAIIATILVICIAVGVFYFAFPAEWNKLFGKDEALSNPDGHLAVHFLDVGQGDSIIVQLPDGKNIIIDAGGNTVGNNHGISAGEVIINAIDDLGITEFEHMILTHSDADHVDFMDNVLEKYKVNNIYRPAFLSKSEAIDNPNSPYSTVDSITYDNFIVASKAEGATIHYNIGDFVITGAGYHIDMQCVDDKYYTKAEVGKEPDSYEKNLVSPFTVLRYGNIDERVIVFTGDAEGGTGSSGNGNGAEGTYLEQYNPKYDADVLKAGHHGSATSTSDELLKKIDPEHVVFCVGIDSSHGHPSPAVLDRLASYDVKDDNGDSDTIKSYSTKNNGDITLSIAPDGVMTWTSVYPDKPVTPGPQHREANASILIDMPYSFNTSKLWSCVAA